VLYYLFLGHKTAAKRFTLLRLKSSNRSIYMRSCDMLQHAQLPHAGRLEVARAWCVGAALRKSLLVRLRQLPDAGRGSLICRLTDLLEPVCIGLEGRRRQLLLRGGERRRLDVRRDR
jgi:hypothetical protein